MQSLSEETLLCMSLPSLIQQIPETGHCLPAPCQSPKGNFYTRIATICPVLSTDIRFVFSSPEIAFPAFLSDFLSLMCAGQVTTLALLGHLSRSSWVFCLDSRYTYHRGQSWSIWNLPVNVGLAYSCDDTIPVLPASHISLPWGHSSCPRAEREFVREKAMEGVVGKTD